MFARLGGSFRLPTDEAGLRELFASFDQLGDGAVSREELAGALAAMDAAMGEPTDASAVRRAMEMFDTNKNGTLSYEEFCIFILNRARM